MLEKSAKLANLIQRIGLALYLCSYFSQREAADRAMVHSMGHPSWLPLFSIIFLAIAVLTSSVLTLLVLSNKRIDIRGKIVRGYLDLRAFRGMDMRASLLRNSIEPYFTTELFSKQT